MTIKEFFGMVGTALLDVAGIILDIVEMLTIDIHNN